jgi:hypothetical protein|nr:MAG TPA: hypothetical protein [Caudoviricetes sp.]DAO26318.1 MAG TPA: hypothetical protein [Caudoviricetes sp.]
MLKDKYKGYAYSKILEDATDEQIRLFGHTVFFYRLIEGENKDKLIEEFLKDYPPYYPTVIKLNKSYTKKEMANKTIDRGIYKAIFREYSTENLKPKKLDDFVKMLKETIPKRYVELIKNYKLDSYLLNT